MGSTVCKNDLCAATTSHDWKKGWPLRSGGFANLCYTCGSAYEKLVYCEAFHSEETGWRDCSTCGKKLHCGCVVSKSLYEFLDDGGVGCINCANRSRVFTNNEVHKGLNGKSDVVGSQSPLFPNRGVGGGVDEGRLMQLCKIMEDSESNLLPRLQRPELNEPLGQVNKHEIMSKMGEVGPGFSSATPSSVGSLSFSKLDNNPMTLGIKDRYESLAEPSLKMTLGTPSRTSNFVLALSSGVGDGREQSKTPSPSFEPQRNRPILPKPLKSGLGGSSESNKGVISPMRIARPPGEGRGKSQLLPRYWPRITDKELEKLSGDLNSTIVPLFEKVLSASDAGRIGRLVLPKACAEAYFPSISQSEGLPLRVQDVKGNEWTFQFRFWPNNNSRMYVLEGVTPCIQAMQLQAGDTVTFSRIDPGGKLVMGFRKASNNRDIQDGESSAQPNGFLGESSFPGATENPPTGNGYPGVHQINKGSKDALAEPLHLANGDLGLHKSEANGFRKSEDTLQQPAPTSEKKRTRNIGSKSKRLLMHSEDVLELRLTWEEAQDLLRPPPSANPNIVTIEDHEFEEYDVPPVFGKRTLFISKSPGGQEQWAQCDDCSKWRKLPVEVLLPPKWTCSDNEWDASRGSCSSPEEISLRELENLIRASRDLKKRRTSEHHKSATQHEPSGLDALASAAVLGDNLGEVGETSSAAAATTTRHPRHRPGCSCIVCIQPPSGKGKHKPTCTCNVCMTVKRRFKTLMLRKKKLQSEREPEPEPRPPRKKGDASETNCADQSENSGGGGRAGVSQVAAAADHAAETSAGQIIDLNCHPSREDMHMETDEMDILREPASEYVKPSGTNMNTDASMHEQKHPGFNPCLLEKQKSNGDGVRDVKDERYVTATPGVWKGEPSRINEIFIDPNLD